MENGITNLSKIYSLSEGKFDEYFKKALLVFKAGKTPSSDKKLIIVGGQSGAGKTRLIPSAKKELSNNAVIVDFDELRALHPYYKQVSESYPELSHIILHPDTEKVKNAVLENLRNEGYNVIYEGALRNTDGFLKFAREFKEKDYQIQINVMAVPKLESYGSTFVRYATALLSNISGRWVMKEAHDGSYEGVTRTVKAFVDEGLSDNIRVFVRDEESPKEIYSTNGRQFENAIDAITYGREIGRKKAIKDFSTKYKTVKGILEDKHPELVDKLKDWEDLYKNEVQYFDRLEKGDVSREND